MKVRRKFAINERQRLGNGARNQPNATKLDWPQQRESAARPPNRSVLDCRSFATADRNSGFSIFLCVRTHKKRWNSDGDRRKCRPIAYVTRSSTVGVSRPPVLDCETIFHPDYAGRDLPSTPSDNLWKLIYLATEALSDPFKFIGAI